MFVEGGHCWVLICKVGVGCNIGLMSDTGVMGHASQYFREGIVLVGIRKKVGCVLSNVLHCIFCIGLMSHRCGGTCLSIWGGIVEPCSIVLHVEQCGIVSQIVSLQSLFFVWRDCNCAAAAAQV